MIDRDHEFPLAHQAQQLEISGSIYYLPRACILG
jgi:putative transposase